MADSSDTAAFFKLHGVFADDTKMILIGPSNSGKSAFRIQMECWSVPNFTENDYSQFRYVIQENVVSFIQSVYEKIDRKHIELSPQFLQLLDPFLQYKSDSMKMDEIKIDDIKSIIKDPIFHEEMKGLSDDQYPHALTFINQLDTLLDPTKKILPSTIAKIRVRTVGFTRQAFILNGKIIQVIDVGGAIMERNKANLINSGVSKVLFFASLCDFDLPLFEDETKNRFQDTIEMYKEACVNPAYENAQFYLILTHPDRLEARIKHSNCFKNYFTEFNGDPHNVTECISYMSSLIISSSMRPVVKFVCNITDTAQTREVIINITEM